MCLRGKSKYQVSAPFFQVENKRLAPWLGEIVITVNEQLSLNPSHGSIHKGISTLKESHYLEVITQSSSFNICKIQTIYCVEWQSFCESLKLLVSFEKCHHLCLILCYQSFFHEKMSFVFSKWHYLNLEQDQSNPDHSDLSVIFI